MMKSFSGRQWRPPANGTFNHAARAGARRCSPITWHVTAANDAKKLADYILGVERQHMR
jgi:hypothetical protein